MQTFEWFTIMGRLVAQKAGESSFKTVLLETDMSSDLLMETHNIF